VVIALAASVTASTIAFGPRAVGGADEYGYASQADLWLTGRLSIEQPFVRQLPWRRAEWAFTPLGYRPHPHDPAVIVPVYSPGLPLLLALAKLAGGQTAMFVVVPIAAGLLVLGTHRVGQRLNAGAAATAAAWLVATSPVVLFMATSTMSDVPVATAWTWAWAMVLGTTVWSSVGAGALSGFAVLIRPNLAPLVCVLALHYLLLVRHAALRRQGIAQLAAFTFAALPGIAAVAAINANLYGSPFSSGYGALSDLFAWSRVPTNARLYLLWLAEAHTPVALGGLAAVLLPFRALWPGVPDRGTRAAIAIFVVVVWLICCAWLVFGAWWFARFLLTSWPFIMLGVGGVAAAVYRVSPGRLRPIVIAVVIALGVYQFTFAVDGHAFEARENRRRFVAAARVVRSQTGENSAIVSLDHNGSIRYYGGRMTINYEALPRGTALDDIVAWLDARGVRTYLAVEDWELPEIKSRFVGSRCLIAIDRPPVAISERPGRLLLFDLTAPRPPEAKPVVEADMDIGSGAARPVPLPRLVLTEKPVTR
jgi:hypothetical protein